MDSNKDFLHRQLIRLGDMMGDGLHHEPDGKWIPREYKKIARALGLIPKHKKNTKGINEFMKKAIQKHRCQKCDETLKQTRSGSLRATCTGCGAKYQLGKRVRK
ncbi:MAG TPA: hypothetical protein DHV36_09520 [Desulfobacteraceae bacterium]|nr:hypothetical protein [Desulfobacteraceae bacterium]